MLTKKINFLPLKLNLQHFAEPTEPSNPQEPTNPDPPANNEPKEPKNEQQGHMIPKSRFDEVNNNYKTVKEELDAIKKQQEEEARKAKEKQGEFESLYQQANEELTGVKTNYESAKEKAERLEGVVNNMLTAKLEGIPEEFHDLVPDNLSPEQKLDWISKAETKGLFKDKTQEPVGGSTNPGPTSSNLDDMSAHQLLSAGYGSKK